MKFETLGHQQPIIYYIGIFDLVVFKVILGSFGALSLNWSITGKRLVIEQNGMKLETHGYSYNIYVVPLTLRCSMSYWGRAVHLSYTSLDRRAKRSEIWNSGIQAIHILVYLTLVVFRVILMSFSALVSKWP